MVFINILVARGNIGGRQFSQTGRGGFGYSGRGGQGVFNPGQRGHGNIGFMPTGSLVSFF